MGLQSRAAYIKGLLEGYKIRSKKKETTLLISVIDLLVEVCDKLDEVELSCNKSSDAINGIEDDLVCLGETLRGMNHCACHHDEDGGGNEVEYNDEGSVESGEGYDTNCPRCGGDIHLTEEDLRQDGTVCPACGQSLEFDFEDDSSEG